MCVNCTYSYCHSKIGLLTLDFLLLLHVLLLVLLLIVMFPLTCFIADTLLAYLHADVNQATNIGDTPMHAAARGGHSDTVKVLASLHADVNQATNGGWTPLKIATQCGKEDTAAVLRSLGGRM